MIAKRGCVPEDERNFSPESLSSDSIILDRCISWVNLNEACLTKHGVKSFRVW